MSLKGTFALVIALILSLITLAGCTPKLATVRPAEVTELRVERLSDGAVSPFNETMKVAEKLIFQLEEPYTATGTCSESDGHKYHVTLYLGIDEKKIDAEVFINEDGSVCRGGKRYVPSDKAEEPVNVADWDALFDLSGAEPQQEDPSEAPEAAPSPGMEDTPPAEAAQSKTTLTGSMEVTAAQGAPMTLEGAVELVSEYPEEFVGPWSYIVGDAVYDGQEFTLLLRRDTASANIEWIAAIPQPMDASGLRHEIIYEGGANDSEGRFLYFTLRDAEDYHRSLWVLDTETLYFNLMYDVPCSNMVIPQEPGEDYAGLGWIIYEDYLIPVVLETADEYTGGIIDLEEYYSDAGDELFRGIGDWGTHKYVQLLDAGNNALEIVDMLAQPGTDAPERVVSSHQIDYATLKFN